MRQLRNFRGLRRRTLPTIGRSSGPPSRPPLPPAERRRIARLALFGLMLATALALLLLVRPPSDFDLTVGAPSPVSINAPYTISYPSQSRTAAERENAANDPGNIVYSTDPRLLEEQQDELRKTLESITLIRSNPSLTDKQRLQQLETLPSLAISETLALTILSYTPDQWRAVSERVRNLYYDTVRDYHFEIDEATLAQIKERYLPYNARMQDVPNGREVVSYLVGSFLRVNREIDIDATRRQQEQARQQVPQIIVTIQRNQNIIREGDIVNNEHLEKLRNLGLISPSLELQQVAGRGLFAAIVATMLCTYLYFYGRPVWRRARPLLVLGLLFVLPVVTAKMLLPTRAGSAEALPIAAFMILAGALFGGQVGVIVAALVSITLGLLGDRFFQLAMVTFVGSLAGIFAIQRPERTIMFLRAGFWVAAALSMSALAMRLTEFGIPTRSEISIMLGFSLFSGALSGLLALGTYNALGRLAGIVTPLQLLELAHPNQPLLRRLMQEAPGTYHHSVVISNLAENAAEAVGGDSLLVRVGAYYHDIGKTLRPYFFSDNQHNRANVHESLDPKTSARLIADHVKEGVVLARAHGLPEPIIDFIRQHHGTSVIKYFYQQALQRDDSASVDDYRYPGPRPQSRETAILMLADGVEATVRSREQAGMLRPVRPPDDGHEAEGNGRSGGQTIEEVVEQVIQERVRSGELDESPLTLRDLNLIKESFVKTLQGIYHPRVEYPNLVKEKERA